MALKQNEGLTPEPEPKKVVEQPTEEVKTEETPKETPKAKEDKGGTTPDILKRIEGKSQEELAKIIADQEKMIGEQSTVISTQKDDLGRYEGQQTQTPRSYQQTQFPNPLNPYGAPNPYGVPHDQSMGYPGHQQPQPYFQPGMQPWGQPQGPPPISYDDLDGSIEQKIRWHSQQEQQRRMVEERTRYSQDMRNAYEEGKHRAFKTNPKLFKGIERDVESGIMAGVQRGVFSQSDLRRDDTWEMAGKLARLQRNEFGYLQPEQQPPVSAPHSETPAGIKEETTTPVTLTPEEQAFQNSLPKNARLTDEEVQAIKKGGK